MMSVRRWDPFNEMLSLREAMDSLLESSYIMPRLQQQERGAGAASLDLDIMDEEGTVVVRASLPGFRPEDVDVTVHGDTLTIRGESREEREAGKPGSRYYLRERRTGTVARRVQLPASVNAEACQAEFQDGVLTIRLPQAESARAKRISVRPGEERPAIEGRSKASNGHENGNGKEQRRASEGRRQRQEETAHR